MTKTSSSPSVSIAGASPVSIGLRCERRVVGDRGHCLAVLLDQLDPAPRILRRVGHGAALGVHPGSSSEAAAAVESVHDVDRRVAERGCEGVTERRPGLQRERDLRHRRARESRVEDPEEEGDFMAFEQLMAEAAAKKDSKDKDKHHHHDKKEKKKEKEKA